MKTNYNELLREKKLRVTPKRVALLEVLSTANKPFDVETIIEKLNVSIDQATVYRILEVLTKKKLIKQIDFKEGKYRYEIEHEHHHHLLCTSCKKVIPVYETCLNIDEKGVLDKHDFKITDHTLEFFGICSSCR